jgi:hypothetical protein
MDDDETDDQFIAEESVFGVIHQVLSARREFFDMRFQRLLDPAQRSTIIARYMLTDASLLELANRALHSSIQSRNLAANIIYTLTPRAGTQAFSEPVVVAPTAAEIERALEATTPVPHQNCAVCQDVVSSDGAVIRHCRHTYHRHCLMSWFSMSVRCPVCRFDIREQEPPADRADQTSPVSARTRSRSPSQ